MTNSEFSDTFATLLNSYGSKAEFGNQSAQDDIVLDEYEKSVYLSMAQDDIVKSYIDKELNRQNQGIDDTARRQVDFSSLTTVAAIAQSEDANSVSQSDLDYIGYSSSVTVRTDTSRDTRISSMTPAMSGARSAYARRDQGDIPDNKFKKIGHQALGDTKERINLIRLPINQQPSVTGHPTTNIFYDQDLDSTGGHTPLQEWDIYSQGLACKLFNDIIWYGLDAVNRSGRAGEPVYITLHLKANDSSLPEPPTESQWEHDIILRLVDTSNIEAPKSIDQYNEGSYLHITGIIYKQLTRTSSYPSWKYEDYIDSTGKSVYVEKELTTLFTNNDGACLINSFLITTNADDYTTQVYPMTLGSFNFGANQVFSYGTYDSERIKINNGYNNEPTLIFPAKLTSETKQKTFILQLDNVVSFDKVGNVSYKDAGIVLPKNQADLENFENNKVQRGIAYVNSDNDSIYPRFWNYQVSGKIPVSEGYYEYVYLNILLVQEGLPEEPSPEPGPEPTPTPEYPKAGYSINNAEIHIPAEGGQDFREIRFYDGATALDRYNEGVGSGKYFVDLYWESFQDKFTYGFFPAGVLISATENKTKEPRVDNLVIVMYDKLVSIPVIQDAPNYDPTEEEPEIVPVTNIDFSLDPDTLYFNASGGTSTTNIVEAEGSSLIGANISVALPEGGASWFGFNRNDLQTIIIDCGANSGITRSATLNVTVTSTDRTRVVSKQLVIVQDGAPDPEPKPIPDPEEYLDIHCESTLYFRSTSVPELKVTYDTDAQGIDISVPASATWLQISEGRDAFLIQLDDNPSHEKRQATFTVSRHGGSFPHQITVVQDEKPYIEASPIRIVASADGGKYYINCTTSATTTFDYVRNGSFYIVKRLGSSSGSTNTSQIEVVFQKNKEACERNTQLVLKAINSFGEEASVVISILQEAATIYVDPNVNPDSGTDTGTGTGTGTSTDSSVVFSTSSTVYDDRSVVFKLPPRKDGTRSLQGTTDVLVILQEKLQAKNKTTGYVGEYVIKPISYAEYDRQMSKAYAYPLKKQAWRLFQNQSTGFDVMCEIIPPNAVKKSTSDFIYKLRYIRRPRPIILENLPDGLNIDGYTKESTCQLNPIMHMDIITRAVELVLATRGRKIIPQNTDNNR